MVKKSLIFGGLAVVVVIAVGVYIFAANLDSLIKTAIETYGSEMTKAKVTLDKVEVSPTSGVGALSGSVAAHLVVVCDFTLPEDVACLGRWPGHRRHGCPERSGADPADDLTMRSPTGYRPSSRFGDLRIRCPHDHNINFRYS